MERDVPPRTVRIRYLRPPDRRTVFHQELVLDRADVKVTLARDVDFELEIRGQPALEPGGDAVWFTFPGAWHDIGRFHRADGAFTGLYANVLTPPALRDGDVWETTDLFLDVWVPATGGDPVLLDEEELREAVRRGWVDHATSERAWREAEALLGGARHGSWPPPVVEEWTRERARAAAEERRPGPG